MENEVLAPKDKERMVVLEESVWKVFRELEEVIGGKEREWRRRDDKNNDKKILIPKINGCIGSSKNKYKDKLKMIVYKKKSILT